MHEKTKPIYSGKPEDFLWVGFGSGSGTNLRECAKVVKPGLIFSDRPKAELLNLEELAEVPKLVLNGYKACGSWKKIMGNPGIENLYKKRSIRYNKKIVKELKRFEEEKGKGIDLIVLGGYMRIVEDPLIEAYHDKIINVHPADLSILKDNERLYIGEDAVYDAIKAGETKTRSSVILVDKGIDHGEILTQGQALDVCPSYLNLPVAEKQSWKRHYADAHQGLQKEVSDWPALTLAIKLISEGRLALGTEKVYHDEWRPVYFDCLKFSEKGVVIGCHNLSYDLIK